MKVALLDVSVLFALIYQPHERHLDAHAWFAKSSQFGWATCAHTQMSVMRLLSSSFAPDLNLPLRTAAAFVRQLCAHPNHSYWPQDIVPCGTDAFDWEIPSSRQQFPDLYLLALAVRNDGVLVTLDRKIGIAGVRGARAEHLLVL